MDVLYLIVFQFKARGETERGLEETLTPTLLPGEFVIRKYI